MAVSFILGCTIVAVEDVAFEDVAVEDVAVEHVAVEDVAMEDVAIGVLVVLLLPDGSAGPSMKSTNESPFAARTNPTHSWSNSDIAFCFPVPVFERLSFVA